MPTVQPKIQTLAGKVTGNRFSIDFEFWASDNYGHSYGEIGNLSQPDGPDPDPGAYKTYNDTFSFDYVFTDNQIGDTFWVDLYLNVCFCLWLIQKVFLRLRIPRKITWKYSMIFISIVISTIMSLVNGWHPSMLKKCKLQNEGCLKAWE
ncbi:MAG: hypothetical protein GQ575_00635 [Deltaproteobacteria bacterium]|nr:hypothetical protein [Deltaproteobacteria bacterium]